MSKNYAIIVAAGKGSRMRANVNKQFINIKDKPILYYTIDVFEHDPYIDGIILVAAKEEINYCKNKIVEKFNFHKIIDIVSGGKDRQESVLNGLRAIKNYYCDIVLIHDGARPFVNSNLILDGIKFAKKYGACACGVKPKDTIKVKSVEGFSIKTLDRSNLINIQTPQCFAYDLIYECHENMSKSNLRTTDDTAVVESFGTKVYIYEGDYDNIKITTPEDLVFATKILENKEKSH